MPGTKPSGPHRFWADIETTFGSFEAFTIADDAIKHLASDIGNAARVRNVTPISRCDRGRHQMDSGPWSEIPWTVTIPMHGTGTAGTPSPARAALFQAAGFSSTVSGGVSVIYEADSANPSTSCSIYRADRNSVVGEQLLGCIVQTVTYEYSMEAIPQITFSGLAARKWSFAKTTLDGGIDDAVTSVTFADDTLFTGQSGTSSTNLEMYVMCESEVLKITAFNHTTKVATVAARQAYLGGGAAAAHVDTTAVTPITTCPTFLEDSGVQNGAHDWTVNDGAAATYRSLTIECATGRMYDPLESGETYPTAVNNGPIEVGLAGTKIFDTDLAEKWRSISAHTDLAYTITGGSTAGSIFTTELGAVELTEGIPTNPPPNEIFEAPIVGICKDTATALRGQVKHTET